ncbi:hypothetical protein C3941_00770 [Kaistia algarum]|nr:hypothetical protein C3941_00770 [Kaistia algarum]
MLLAAVVGAGFWYWRLHAAKTAVDDVVDQAGRLHGAYKRRKFRNKAQASTLSGIEDPAIGATVLFVSLVEAGGPFGPDHEKRIDGWLREVADYASPVEALTFARWASREVVDGNDVVRRMLPLFNNALSPSEKDDLLEFAGNLASSAGEPEPAQKDMLRRLRSGLVVPS